MQTDVCIRIINEKMNKKIWAAGFSVIPAIIAFGFGGTLLSFLAVLGQKSSVLCMLLCSNGP